MTTQHPRRPRDDQRGASAAEYALLLSLLAVALIAAFLFFGQAVFELFGRSGSAVSSLPR